MVLKHRRLLFLSLITLLSVFIAEALPHRVKAVFFWFFVLLSLLFLGISLGKRRFFVLFLAALLAAGALLASYQVSHKRAIATALAEEKQGVYSVTVLSVTKAEEDSYTAEGRLTAALDGKVLSLHVKISSPISVSAGDVLFGNARFFATEEDSYDAAQGFYGVITFSDCKRMDRLSSPLYALGNLRAFLTKRLSSLLPAECGALLSALLLGVRDGLPGDFTRDMKRIGTTHMLSLSGMHLAVLTAGIAFLLRRLRIGRHARTAALCAFVVLFMLVTGLYSSVMRAGFMFLFSALPFFLREERDGISSLAAAVAVICLCEPYATRDLSLWLSALATLGILLFFDGRRRQAESAHAPLSRLLDFILLSLSVTLSATLATLPLTLCAFGKLPLLSLPANLILSPLVQLALYLSLLVTALGNVPVITWITTRLCNLIFTFSRFLADVPNTVLSFGNPLALPLIFIAVAFLLLYFLLCPRKRFRFRVPLAICLSFAFAVGAAEGVPRLLHRNELTVTYYTDRLTASDAILFRYRGECLLSVISDFSALGKAERAAFAEVADELDGFLLPYYTDGTESYVAKLFNAYKLYRLYLPCPRAAWEREVYGKILTAAAKNGVTVVTFKEDEPFFFDYLTVSNIAVKSGKGRPESVFAEFLFGYARIGYFSGGAVGFSRADEALASDLLIFGVYPSPPAYLFRREDFIEEHTRVFCAAPVLFPFADMRGIVFSEVGEAYIPMQTAVR